MTFKNIFARKTNRLVNRKFTPLWLFVSGAALEACGSSDGGGDAILQEFYAEGAAGGALFTVDAADPTSLEAVDITYQIQSQTDSSGNDIALFVINSRGEVTIAPGAVFDYENPEGISETDFLSLTPAERDNANIYNIKIVATIKANDETTETETTFTYAVKITDEPDAAVLSTMSNVKPTGTVSVSPPSADNTNDIEIPIADFLKAFDDQDTHSDNQINQLSFSDIPTGVALRYGGNVIETGDIFDIRAGGTIVATIDENVAVGEVVLEYSGFEGGIAITGASLSFSVTNAPNIGSVTDAANEVVTDGAIEILENTADDIAIFKIAVSDIDADQALSYSLEGADAGLFDVNPDGTDANIALITFRSAVGADGAFSPDFEVPGSDGGDNIYSITFVVIDNLGGSSNLDLGVTILDQDEAATDIILSSEAIAEDETATQIGGNDVYLVGTLSVTDPDGADSGFTVNALSLAADELDGGSFVIDDNKLYLKHKPDFETKSSYSVTIIATGSGVAAPSYTETITVNVEGVNEAPTLSDSVSLGDVKKGNADTDGKDLTILQLLSGAGYSDQDVDDNLDNISKIEITSISDAGNLVLTYTDSVDTPVTLAVGDLIALDGTLDGNINVKIKDSVADDTLFTVGYKVYDSGGLASDEASLTFTATSVAVNFDGVLPVTLEENSATSDPIATVSASVDGTGYGAISYSLIGDNSNLFEIDSASGEITLTGELDYEVAKEHALTVLVTAMHTSGATITSSTLVTVNVNDVDETPTKIEIFDDNDDLGTSIEENKEADQIDGNDVYFVGEITVTDPDGADSGFTNALTLGGTNASSFVIADNKLYLLESPNAEATDSYSITIIANDSVTETRYETAEITITVSNVDDLAVVTVFDADGTTLIDDPIAEIAENVDEQTLYVFSGTDEDKNALDVNQIVKFEIDNTVGHGSLFQLIEDSAASKWALSFIEAPNFEAVNAPAGNLYSVIVTAYSVDADGDEVTDTLGNRVEVLTTVNVKVTDVVGESARIFVDNVLIVDGGNGLVTNVAVHENVYNAAFLSASDDDANQEVRFEIKDGGDGALFEITADDNLRFIRPPDFETPLDDDEDNGYSVTVTAYSYSTGDDGTGNEIGRIAGSEVDTIVNIQVTDDGSAADEAIVFSPTADVLLDADSNIDTPIATVVASVAAGYMISYSLVGDGVGDGKDLFAIDDNGVITLTSALDQYTAAQYSLGIIATASDGTDTYYFSTSVTVNIADVDEAPTDIMLSSEAIEENSIIGVELYPGTADRFYLVGTIIVTDPDDNSVDNPEYFANSLSLDDGLDKDKFYFNVFNRELYLREAPDSETTPNYSIKFTATSDTLSTLSYTKTITISIKDADEAATDIKIAGESEAGIGIIVEDVTATQIGGNDVYLAGEITVTDPDGADSGFTANTLSLGELGELGETDTSNFVIDDNKLYLKHKPDFETKSSYSVTIISTGSGVAAPSYTETITVNVGDAIDEAPVIGTDAVSIGDVKKGADDGKTLTFLKIAGTLDRAGYSDPDADDNLDNLSRIEITSISSDATDNTAALAALTLTYTDAADGSTPVTFGIGNQINPSDGTVDGNINIKIAESVADGTVYTVKYKIYDSAGLASADEGTLTFTASDAAVNFATVIDFVTVKLKVTLTEKAAANTGVETISASVDATASANYGAVSYSIASGSASEYFNIDQNTGLITLAVTGAQLDYESNEWPYFVTVKATATHNTDKTKELTSYLTVKILVEDVNEAPRQSIRFVDNVQFYNDSDLRITEGTLTGVELDPGGDGTYEKFYLVGTVIVTDPDDLSPAHPKYSDNLLSIISNNDDFYLDTADNKFYLTHRPDFETKSAYDDTLQFGLNIFNSDYLSEFYTEEVVKLIETDLSFISYQRGGISLRVLNAFGGESATVNVLSADGVTEITAPINNPAEIVEDSLGVIYQFSGTDDDNNQTVKFRPLDVNLGDNRLFRLTEGDGVDADKWLLNFKNAPDFENPLDINDPRDEDGNNIYSVTVTAYSVGANGITKVPDSEEIDTIVRVKVINTDDVNVDDAATSIKIVADDTTPVTRIAENLAAETDQIDGKNVYLVGTIIVTDPDGADSGFTANTLSLGSTSEEDFVIAGNKLYLLESPDFETKSRYSVEIIATSDTLSTLSYTETIDIAVTDADEPAVMTVKDATGTSVDVINYVVDVYVAENNLTVATLSGTDEDATILANQIIVLDAYDFSSSPTGDNNLFNIHEISRDSADTNEWKLNFKNAPDFENLPTPANGNTNGIYSVTINADSKYYWYYSYDKLYTVPVPGSEFAITVKIHVTNADDFGIDDPAEITVFAADGITLIDDPIAHPAEIDENVDEQILYIFSGDDIDVDETVKFRELDTSSLFQLIEDPNNAGQWKLSFKEAPDFEDVDAPAGNIYSVTVTAYSVDDSESEIAGSEVLTTVNVRLSDVDEAPTDIKIAGESDAGIGIIVEDVTATQIGGNDVYLVGTLSVTDPDGADSGFTVNALSLAADELDGGSFVIDDNKLYLKHKPDFETKSSYSVTIIATSDITTSLSYTETITVNVGDIIDEAPVIGTDAVSIGDVKTGDTATDGKTLTFSEIAGIFYNAGYSDEDAGDNLDNLSKIEITSISSDATDNTAALAALTLTYTGGASSADATINGSPTTPVAFGTDGTSGKFDGSIDVKIADTVTVGTFYTVKYKIYDSGGLASAEASLTFTAASVAINFATIPIISVDEGPAFTPTQAVPDPTAFADLEASVTGSNDYGAVSYSIPSSGSGSQYFTIDPATGEITHDVPGALLDYETASEHFVTVLATATHNTDNTKVLTAETTVRVLVNDADDAPTKIEIIDDNDTLGTSIAENVATETIPINNALTTVYLVGEITVTDPDVNPAFTANTLSLAADELDGGSFVIDGNKLYLLESPDFETKSSYSVKIIANAGTATVYETDAITITVADADDLIDEILVDGVAAYYNVGTFSLADPVSVAENTLAVATLSGSDEDVNQEVRFEIDDPDSLFTVTEDGVLSFKADAAPDFETPRDADRDNIYSVTVTAYSVGADGGAEVLNSDVELRLIVKVTPVDDNLLVDGGFAAAFGVSGTDPSYQIAEGSNTEIGTFSGSDADSDQVVRFEIKAGDDATLFTVTEDGVLSFTSAPDFETPLDTGADNIYSVTVTAYSVYVDDDDDPSNNVKVEGSTGEVDGIKNKDEQTLSIQVTDIDEGSAFQKQHGSQIETSELELDAYEGLSLDEDDTPYFAPIDSFGE